MNSKTSAMLKKQCSKLPIKNFVDIFKVLWSYVKDRETFIFIYIYCK